MWKQRHAFLALLGVLSSACGTVNNPHTPDSVSPANSTMLDKATTPATPEAPRVTVASTIAIDDSKTLAPSEPNIQGEPLTLDGYLNSDSTDEINCDEAETLVDEGLFEANDIADYCDYGPQNGEIDDSFEWEDDVGNP